MTPEQIELALRMREDHHTRWERIADHFGLSVYQLRVQLDPKWREYRNKQTRETRAKYRKPRAPREEKITNFAVHHHVVSVRCPGDLLTERDRRLSIPHRDFTSQFFGDPRPGYSALDKRKLHRV